MARGHKGKGISQELVAKSRSFIWNGKHDDIMLEILYDAFINGFGKDIYLCKILYKLINI